MNSNCTLKKTGTFLLVNALFALVICLVFSSEIKAETSWWRVFFLNYFLYSFLISVMMSGGIGYLIDFSGRHFSWVETPLKRLLFDLVLVISYSFLASFLLSLIFGFFIWKNLSINDMSWSWVVSSTTLPILISLGFTFFFTSRSFLLEWKQSAIAFEKMKSERLAGQYQSLKDQLNPHFLFNSLNVLSNLVYEDPDKANSFIEKLATVYRYVLDVQDEKLVNLKDELKFARNYLDLQKLRFGDKLQYSAEVDETDEFVIPPLSLQLLLENAVKHNSATVQNPLVIEIVKQGDRLVVKNNLQMREQRGTSSGIGLNNITERYRFFTSQVVRVSNDGGYFSVSIPLLKSE